MANLSETALQPATSTSLSHQQPLCPDIQADSGGQRHFGKTSGMEKLLPCAMPFAPGKPFHVHSGLQFGDCFSKTIDLKYLYDIDIF